MSTSRWTEQQYADFVRKVTAVPLTNKALKSAKAIIERNGLELGQSPATTSPTRSKYGNRKVTDASGAVHDSGKEFRRWQVLELRERAGEIRSLRRQVPYALVVNGVLVCQYIADAVYVEGEATIVEDTKSDITRKKDSYRIKLKLMQAIHGIQIREV
jgi:hypothetical protein